MGHEFITRSLKTCAVVLLIFVPFGLYYLSFWSTLATVSGAVWGILNLIFLSKLIRLTIRPDGVVHLPAIGIALFKFPLLYGAGYFLLKVPQFNPVYLVAGFTSVLLIIVLRVMGKALVYPDNGGKLQKVA